MPATDAERLGREARVFGRALLGRDPSAYAIRKYAHFHETIGIPVSGFDRVLTRVALFGTFWVTAADAYACRFARASAVRKKLVVMLAVCECAAPDCEYLDRVDATHPALVTARLAWRAAVHAGAFATALVLLAPLHALSSLRRQQ